MAITKQQVQEAVSTLNEEGKQPSLRNIRAILGTGNHATIQKHLKNVIMGETLPSPLDAAEDLIGELLDLHSKMRYKIADLNQVRIQAEKVAVSPSEIPNEVKVRIMELMGWDEDEFPEDHADTIGYVSNFAKTMRLWGEKSDQALKDQQEAHYKALNRQSDQIRELEAEVQFFKKRESTLAQAHKAEIENLQDQMAVLEQALLEG